MVTILTLWSSGQQWLPSAVTPVSLHMYVGQPAAGWPATASGQWMYQCPQRCDPQGPHFHSLIRYNIVIYKDPWLISNCFLYYVCLFAFVRNLSEQLGMKEATLLYVARKEFCCFLETCMGLLVWNSSHNQVVFHLESQEPHSGLLGVVNNISDRCCLCKNKTHPNRLKIPQIQTGIHHCWRDVRGVGQMPDIIHMITKQPHN